MLVCLDETSKQQVRETRSPLPPRPGTAMAYDYEYERNGVSNLFMLFAPLEGWRRVEVTDQRTKADWARVVRQLVDETIAKSKIQEQLPLPQLWLPMARRPQRRRNHPAPGPQNPGQRRRLGWVRRWRPPRRQQARRNLPAPQGEGCAHRNADHPGQTGVNFAIVSAMKKADRKSGFAQ